MRLKATEEWFSGAYSYPLTRETTSRSSSDSLHAQQNELKPGQPSIACGRQTSSFVVPVNKIVPALLTTGLDVIPPPCRCAPPFGIRRIDA